MSEPRSRYSTGGGSVTSAAQDAIAEISGYYAIIPAELIYSRQTAAIVLYGVLDRIAKYGKGFAGFSQLCEATGFSESTIRRARKYLIEQGWLVIVKMGSGHLSTDYHLPFQMSRGRGVISDTPGVPSEKPQPETLTREKPESLPEDIINPVSEDDANLVWPEWYAILYALPNFKTSLSDAEKWLSEKGVNVGLAEKKAYALRAWWHPKQHRDRSVWATFQAWCRADQNSAPPTTGGNNHGQPQDDIPANSQEDRATRLQALADSLGRPVAEFQPKVPRVPG